MLRLLLLLLVSYCCVCVASLSTRLDAVLSCRGATKLALAWFALTLCVVGLLPVLLLLAVGDDDDLACFD